MRSGPNDLFSLILPLAVCLLALHSPAQANAAQVSADPTSAADGIAAGSDEQRPRIGLVLSGGGARGFAHIGALRVIEENNIPIDYIAGTSMGSIIGGLYAIGMTPDDIEKGVKGIDWLNVFNDSPDRAHRYFRRKQDNLDFFSMHRVGVTRDGLQITPGIIEGQQIEIALDRLAYPGFQVHDFDQLHIPYRAIATDIATGEPVVIKHGNLARAMRASMSIPGAVPPIIIDEQLLVDGGIGNNIPIDVVRDMGADIVIVVDVSAPLESKENIKSSIDVTGQLTTILTRRTADENLASLGDDDVLIIPAAREISSSDFIEYPALIEEGHRAAMHKLPGLAKLGLTDDGYRQYKAALPRIMVREPVIDFIEVDNRTALRDEVFRVRISQETGKPLDVPRLERDIAYIYGLDYSSSVVYDVEKRGDQYGLVVYVRDREWARSYLEFGLSVESTFEVNSVTNLSASYTDKNLNDLGGEVRVNLAVGTEPELIGEFYQPMNSYLNTFFAIKGGAETEIIPIQVDSHVVSVVRNNQFVVEASFGQLLTRNTSLSLGIGARDGNFNSISGLQVKEPDYTESYYFLQLLHDSLDNLSFPSNGYYGGIKFESNQQDLGADLNYDQLRADLGGALSFDRYTVFARLKAETTSNEDNLPLNAYLVNGGFLELSGTIRNELVSPHFGLLQTAFYRRLGNISFLPMFAGFSLEAGNAWQTRDEIDPDNLVYAGSLYVGADTFMGPLYLGYGHTDGGENAVYLYIGTTFLED